MFNGSGGHAPPQAVTASAVTKNNHEAQYRALATRVRDATFKSPRFRSKSKGEANTTEGFDATHVHAKLVVRTACPTAVVEHNI
jgi:hypothetical protein